MDGHHEWPDDDILDIFLYVPSHFNDPARRQGFARLWGLMGKGLTATEAVRRIEEQRAHSKAISRRVEADKRKPVWVLRAPRRTQRVQLTATLG